MSDERRPSSAPRPSSPPVESHLREDDRMEMEPGTMPAGLPQGRSGQPGIPTVRVDSPPGVNPVPTVADMADESTAGESATRL